MKVVDNLNLPDWLPFQNHVAPRYDLTTTVLPALGVFGAGLLVGAGLGLLLAPKSGRELRGEIADTASNAMDKLPTPSRNHTTTTLNA